VFAEKSLNDLSGSTEAVTARQAEPAPAVRSKQSGKAKATTAKQAPAIKVIKKNKPLNPELLEAKIAEAEKKLNEISARMSLPEVARNATELIKLDEEYRQTEERLTVLYSEWEAVAAKG
jgi:hypothetical protein